MFPLVLPSDQDCSDYRANGFTVFPRFADVSEVDILTAEIERLAASWTTESLFGCVRDRFGVPVVMNRLDKQSDVLYDLARHPRLTLTAERLLGRAAISLHVEYFANTGTAVPAHQDHRSYYDHFRDEAAVAQPREAVLLEIRARDVRTRRRLPGEDDLDRAPDEAHLTEPASSPCAK